LRLPRLSRGPRRGLGRYVDAREASARGHKNGCGERRHKGEQLRRARAASLSDERGEHAEDDVERLKHRGRACVGEADRDHVGHLDEKEPQTAKDDEVPTGGSVAEDGGNLFPLGNENRDEKRRGRPEHADNRHEQRSDGVVLKEVLRARS